MCVQIVLIVCGSKFEIVINNLHWKAFEAVKAR